jgi:hypothetical protein
MEEKKIQDKSLISLGNSGHPLQNDKEMITTGLFLIYLKYYLQVIIFVNKGTMDDFSLQTCIDTYNRLMDGDEKYLRVIQKRYNLLLKMDNNNKPVDIQDKNNQTKMIYLTPHSSLQENNLENFLAHTQKYHICIFKGVPSNFILKDCKYRELIWQYTRLLFFISQVILTKTEKKLSPSEMNHYQNIRSLSMDLIEKILEDVGQIEKKMMLAKLISTDEFLQVSLKSDKYNKEELNEAREIIKNIFKKKGMGNNHPLHKIIDTVVEKLDKEDVTSGNIFEQVQNIGLDVAGQLQGEFSNNPKEFQENMAGITNVFREIVSDDSEIGKQLPPELKKTIYNVMSNTAIKDPNQNFNEKDAMHMVEGLINKCDDEDLKQKLQKDKNACIKDLNTFMRQK